MPISERLIAVLACIPAMAVNAQQQRVSSPLAGYVFDGAALRPVGGATLGDAVWFVDTAASPARIAFVPARANP